MTGDREVTAGRLFINRGTGVFHYDAAYLANPAAYALAPSLPLVAGAQPLDGLGGLSDSALTGGDVNSCSVHENAPRSVSSTIFWG